MPQSPMHLPWPFHDRHKEIIAQPFPDAWLTIVQSRIHHYLLLTSEEQERLLGDLRIFMAEKNWEGALEFEITDEVKVIISALASLLTVGLLKHDYYPNVQTVIVYPAAYVAPSQNVIGQVVEASSQGRLGEAHDHGPVILSWQDILTDSENFGHGHNLALHEFSHKLDFRDGDANGVPQLRDAAEYDDWSQVMSVEYERLVDDVKHSRHSVINSYGATNPAEFFAVCTECFFEKSRALRDQKPELYRVLREYYRIDWAERLVVSRPTP